MARSLRYFVAVTDREWYRFLSARRGLEEVNFWQPGGNRPFRALQPGELFLFKLHRPDHFIVGGGIFVRSVLLPAYYAWEAFGEKNGAASFEEMCLRIEVYRRSGMNRSGAYVIGCVILSDPFFLAPKDWIPAPDDFYPNIVQGKTYDLGSETGRRLWEAVRSRWQTPQVRVDDPVVARPSLGEGTFRVVVTEAYRRRCAVTGERALLVLEAAHIRTISAGGTHRPDNGLLLRRDIHALFRRGYVTVAPDGRFRVSRRLRQDCENGEYYYQFDGRENLASCCP